MGVRVASPAPSAVWGLLARVRVTATVRVWGHLVRVRAGVRVG